MRDSDDEIEIKEEVEGNVIYVRKKKQESQWVPMTHSSRKKRIDRVVVTAVLDAEKSM
jgi:hypothetical protein